MRRWVAGSLIGVGVVLASIVWWLPKVVGLYGAQLDTKAPSLVTIAAKASSPKPLAPPWQVAPATQSPAPGRVLGSLTIPQLRLKTAFVQGTSYGDLLLAPGHFSGSVLPGQMGTSVIAAHNATYFRHLDALRIGGSVVVTTQQGTFWFRVVGHGVVSDTAGLPNLNAQPGLDLEACYPLDALYFTPTRYVVYTVLVKDQLRQSPVTATVSPSVSYSAEILPAIAKAYPLPLSDNSVPMGTMHYVAPSTDRVLAFKQSGNSLEVEARAIDLWDAARYTSQNGNWAWFSSLFVKGAAPAFPNAFFNAHSIVFEAPLDVTLTLNRKGTPTSLRLYDGLVRVNGAAYTVTMMCPVINHLVSVASFQVTPS